MKEKFYALEQIATIPMVYGWHEEYGEFDTLEDIVELLEQYPLKKDLAWCINCIENNTIQWSIVFDNNAVVKEFFFDDKAKEELEQIKKVVMK